MTATYKRKRLKEQESIDRRPTGIRKNLNSAERWSSKRQIIKTFKDMITSQQEDSFRRSELRWDLDQELYIRYFNWDTASGHRGLVELLYKFKIINSPYDRLQYTPFDTNANNYTLEQTIELLGYN